MDFSPIDNSNDREYEILERVFNNGRKIQAVQREAVEYTDGDGTIKYAVKRLATADCGCFSSLSSMYMCHLCSKVMCHNHTSAVPCSSCLLPHLCFRCMVNLDAGDGVPKPLCIKCASEIKPQTILGQVWKAVLEFLSGKKVEENALTRTNSPNNPES